MSKKTVVFDLDGTLIAIDCTQQWLQFLVNEKIPGAKQALKLCTAIMQNYASGTMNMADYMDAWLKPLTGYVQQDVTSLVSRFIEQEILSCIFDEAFERVNWHLQQGDEVAIVSASPLFIVRPIAQLFGVNHVFGIEIELIEQTFSGKAIPPFCFREGKVDAVIGWLQLVNATQLDYAYSDSINDAAILSLATQAFCIKPDPALAALARKKSWHNLDWQ